jgi:CMP-N-acetylneuraminic acid synthetase
MGIIPARGGSKRVPRKNLRMLGGKELVAHSIEAALKAKSLAQVVVSSDSDEVLKVARRYATAVALRRPDALSTDTAQAIEYVRHALAEVAGPWDAVAIIQPSSPLTTAADIDATVRLLEETGSADSAVSVMELEHAIHPVKLKRLVGDRLMPYVEEEKDRMAAHELPRLFVRNCSVYATRLRAIEKGSVIGDDSRGYVMPRERSVDINDELDWEFARFLFERKV